MNCKPLLALACLCASCWSQPGAAADAPPSPEPARLSEPNVRWSSIDDAGARIEELRVRGTTQRIVVTPKTGPRKSYEIITGDGARDLSDGAGSTRGAIGKRVWNVLVF